MTGSILEWIYIMKKRLVKAFMQALLVFNMDVTVFKQQYLCKKKYRMDLISVAYQLRNTQIKHQIFRKVRMIFCGIR
jgi:CRISPR/Cas system-associated protein endoribonuclease Cas2